MLEWKDPPKAGRERADHRAIAAELRAHPGQWALIFTASSLNAARQHATRISNGLGSAYRPARWFEAVARGESDVFARYVGVRGADEVDQAQVDR